MTVAVGTIVAANYVAFARVLAASLREHHPDVPFHVLLADDPDVLPLAAEPYRLLTLQEIGIPDLEDLVTRYDRQQLAIATKPFLLHHLLRQGYERAVFLDADVLVLGDLSPLLHHPAPVTLIPHHLHPLPDAQRELQVLVSGTYNGGVLGVEGSPGARRFLDWWGRRVRQYCHHDRELGVHFDQRWLDLAPSFFECTGTLRDPRIDVAYWNLPERRAVTPALFHFSGFDPARPDSVTRHVPGMTIQELGETAVLFRRYAALLEQAGWRESSRWPYRLGGGSRT